MRSHLNVLLQLHIHCSHNILEPWRALQAQLTSLEKVGHCRVTASVHACNVLPTLFSICCQQHTTVRNRHIHTITASQGLVLVLCMKWPCAAVDVPEGRLYQRRNETTGLLVPYILGSQSGEPPWSSTSLTILSPPIKVVKIEQSRQVLPCHSNC